MLIDFDKIKEIKISNMNNGEGLILAKVFEWDGGKIIPTRIHPGSSIGTHIQKSGDDINYIISGKGKAICNDNEEVLKSGDCHICPKGSTHSIYNIGDEDLVMLTIVVNK